MDNILAQCNCHRHKGTGDTSGGCVSVAGRAAQKVNQGQFLILGRSIGGVRVFRISSQREERNRSSAIDIH